MNLTRIITLCIITAFNFIVLYLSLEGLSFSLIILILILQSDTLITIEASIKYFFSMAISSGYLLFGMATLWNILGTLHYLDVKVLVNYYLLEPTTFTYLPNSLSINSLYSQLSLALFCILYSFFIKLGLFPGHLWVPDVYEGAIFPTMVLLATIVKVGLISSKLRLLFWVFILMIQIWQPLLLFSSSMSIVFSALNAFKQKKIKRFLAFSSIFQMGFFFLSISCGNFMSLVSAITFWLIYFFTLFGIFIILLVIRYTVLNTPIVYLTDLNGFWQVDTRACFTFSVLFLSLAGCPPFLGFWYSI